jgi:hypothetical protein
MITANKRYLAEAQESGQAELANVAASSIAHLELAEAEAAAKAAREKAEALRQQIGGGEG